MGVYTISPALLRSIEKDEGMYLTDILFVFTQTNNSFKVAKDKKGHIIDCYQQIEANGDVIKIWLDLMSFKPSRFESIDVDISSISCEETKFMKMCKETASQSKFITYTHQDIKKYRGKEGDVVFEDTVIKVLDRDEAKQELTVNQIHSNTFINSQVAQSNSQISDSKNK